MKIVYFDFISDTDYESDMIQENYFLMKMIHLK